MSFITPENKEQLVKRFRSLLWRAGAMVGALVVQFLLDNLGLVNLGPQVTIVLGLLLGEATKWFNSKV